jgi:hypothetical protein
LYNIYKSFSEFLLDAAGAVVAATVLVVVVTMLHILMSDKGTQIGDEQHESTTHIVFGDGHPEPFNVHPSNNEHEGAGEHILAPDDVLNT